MKKDNVVEFRTLTLDELGDLRDRMVAAWRPALPLETPGELTPEFDRPLCPVCRRRVVRLQRSGPKGSVTGDRGPVSAYPCGCWLTQETAKRLVGS